jgi:signal transduction histidine kinase/CheY-like chemotaxis protein/HPt (histidine-containing phosphotransfer) domain-containing protein
MEDRIYIINSNYEILYANPAFEQEFPCQEGRKCYERINDHDTACSWCQSGEVLAGRTVRSEWFCERLDKSYDRIAAPLRNADGSLTMLTIFRDITERKRSEMQLQEVNRRLEAATARANEMALQARNASRSKSEFLANMSHEIRTPLNGVIGMTELMLGGELSSEQRRYAEMARSSGQHLLALLNDILDLSKVEAGKLDLETVDFDLQVLLDDVAGAMALPAREKGIELRCAAAPAVPTFLKGDPGRLRQILNNLTGNAVKFTDAGEVSIDISLEAESPDRVLLRFTVRDTGIGIRADKIDMLFQKFVQLDASTTRRYGGTGLGLIISKQLAYMMQGDIGVESEEGRGSRFWFTAWLGKQPREARGTVSSSAVPSSAPREIRPLAGADQCRLLVVEDHPVNREVTLGILEKLGFRADVAATGREALNALIKRPYDLVFMDVQMPDMDGLTATRRIRNADQNICNVPVIAMTAHALAGDRKRCLAAGMTDYIPKPVNSQALADVLSRWLPAVEPDPGGQNSSVAGQPQVPSSPSDSQSQETRSARPLFDASGFWKRVMGDKAFGGKIIVAFLKDIPVQMASLQAALSADDPDRTARQAHTIKGAVANMGGEACCGLAIEIEQAAKAKDLASARRLTARMQEALESLENALKEEVESLETGQQGDQM